MGREPSRRARRYLMEGDHWRIRPVRDFTAFFRTLPLLAPPGAFLALAEGSWPAAVRAVLTRVSASPGEWSPGWLAPEFGRAYCVRVSEPHMAALARLADDHAEPEIAIHLTAFTADGPVLEWFDAPHDPIAVSLSVEADAVSRFAREVGGACEEVKHGV